LKVIYTEHGRLSDAPPSRKRRIANALFGRLPHAVFSVSADLRQHLLQEGFSPDAVGVIYNGIDLGPVPAPLQRTEIRTRLGVADNTFVVGTIARLDPVKDLTTLIHAVAEVAHRTPVLLVVIGDGPERATLEGAARAVGVEERVRFLGHRNDARDWLAACDVYVNCSISEGVSLTILEAMAAKLPIVATRVGGTPEVVDDSSGELIPARNAAALEGALTRLSEDRQRRLILGAGARQRVESRFTLDRMIQEYRDVYERLS
jgi:glycosyltransferase involved in cell wall biosynthesis